jgi:hypothetical protein
MHDATASFLLCAASVPIGGVARRAGREVVHLKHPGLGDLPVGDCAAADGTTSLARPPPNAAPLGPRLIAPVPRR